MQARAHFYSEKVFFCAKNEKLYTLHFQLSTFFTTFVLKLG